jgi:uncharacterized membrane protein
LHPIGYTTSSAYDIDGESQVGVGDNNALLWKGTAASAVDLHPVGFISSLAQAVSGDSQVGYAQLRLFEPHAILWKGTAASAVDLHPVGFSSSQALGVFGNRQVGSGISEQASARHALLWQGTANSAIDLNPAGAQSSEARDIFGNTQVGYAMFTKSETDARHAVVWNGTPASAHDLHPYLALAGLGSEWTESYAMGISSNGDIVGYAGGANLGEYAVKWSLVPEPSALSSQFIAVCLCSMAHRRRLIRSW